MSPITTRLSAIFSFIHIHPGTGRGQDISGRAHVLRHLDVPHGLAYDYIVRHVLVADHGKVGRAS